MKYGGKLYRQNVGIAQGSVLSTHLCNMFYGDMEHNMYLTIQRTIQYFLLDIEINKTRNFCEVNLLKRSPRYSFALQTIFFSFQLRFLMFANSFKFFTLEFQNMDALRIPAKLVLILRVKVSLIMGLLLMVCISNFYASVLSYVICIRWGTVYSVVWIFDKHKKF